MPVRKPEPGDDLLRLSQKVGVGAKEIRDCPENKDLFGSREPHVLFNEDEVFIPEPAPKKVRVRTGETLYLVYAPPKRTLHLQLHSNHGKPREVDYELRDPVYDGTINDKLKGSIYGYSYQGIVHEELPSSVSQIVLVLEDDKEHPITLHLARLDPVSTTRGLKARLLNLGFFRGPLDDTFVPELTCAVQAFQWSVGLPATSFPDGPTLDALSKRHGS